MSCSCKGCKFLYGNGTGYSNWTWCETYAVCALGKNKNLLEKDWEIPYQFHDQETDKWEPTMDSRCAEFKPGSYVELDPDKEIWRESSYLNFDDEEQFNAILQSEKSSGRWVPGGGVVEWEEKPE